MREARTRRSRPDGLTLVEVCLVLALLVVITAFGVPLMEGAISRAAISSGRDLVRSCWAKARLAAIETGQTHVFRFEPNGPRFQVVDIDRLALPESNQLAKDDPDAQHAPADFLRLGKARLPDGVVFSAGDVSSSTQVAATAGDLSAGPWSAPILFHADGTTSDASIVLKNDREQYLRLTLRGLTGITTTTDVESEVPQ